MANKPKKINYKWFGQDWIALADVKGEWEAVGRGGTKKQASDDAIINGYVTNWTIRERTFEKSPLENYLVNSEIVIETMKYIQRMQEGNIPNYLFEEKGLYKVLINSEKELGDIFSGKFMDAISFAVQQPEFNEKSYLKKMGKLYESEDSLLLEIIQRKIKNNPKNL